MARNEREKKKVTILLNRFSTLATQRRVWEHHWQDIADYIVPRKADITRRRTDGEKRTEKIFDGTAIHSAELLTASLHGMLTSASMPWFSLRFTDPMLDGDDMAKEWLENTTEHMYNAFARSNFQEQVHEMYADLVAFGTAVMFVDKDDVSQLRFSTRHIAECFLAEDAHGRVDTVVRKYKMSGRDARSLWGKDIGPTLVPRVKENPYEMIELLHVVQPRDEYDPGISDNLNMRFMSCHIDPENKWLIAESGFDEFPYVAPRFLKASFEQGYGRSPAMTALADVKMLQEMSKTTIKSAQKQVDPPLLVPDDGFVLPVRVTPGGLNFYRSGTRDRIEPLMTGANTPLGLAIENQRREAIRQAFYVDQLMLRESPNMTATEVIARNEEKMRLLGPVLGRLQAEMLQPLITRCFNLLAKQNIFEPAPDYLQAGNIDIEYVSPLAKAQRQGELNSTMRMFEILNPLAQLDPGIFDYIDMDGLVKFITRTIGVPASVLRAEGEVTSMREARAEQQAQQAQLDQASQVADAAGAAAPALKAVGGLQQGPQR
jgi:hypothetical protein